MRAQQHCGDRGIAAAAVELAGEHLLSVFDMEQVQLRRCASQSRLVLARLRLAVANCAENRAAQDPDVTIRVDDLWGPELRARLEEHLASMHLHSPPESVHALPLEQLRRPEIMFWTVWNRRELLGCGALRALNSQHAEIKSMRTCLHHVRKGFAKALLVHMLDEARRRGYVRLSLETGSAAAFAPAGRLYDRFGFSYCGPFGGYIEYPNSVFMRRNL